MVPICLVCGSKGFDDMKYVACPILDFLGIRDFPRVGCSLQDPATFLYLHAHVSEVSTGHSWLPYRNSS